MKAVADGSGAEMKSLKEAIRLAKRLKRAHNLDGAAPDTADYDKLLDLLIAAVLESEVR